MSTKNKNILIYDLSGSYPFIAETMARSFARCFYFSQWQTGFSSPTDFLPGLGLDDVERVADPFDILDDVDLCWFVDVGMGGFQEYLRKHDMPVFGCGRAQILELDRWYFKQELKNAEMDIVDCELVMGIDSLRKRLRSEKDVYIKFSFFRGAMESFHHHDFISSETWIDDLAANLGPYGKIAPFLVEQAITGESVEIGYDGYCVDGEIPKAALFGYEVKDLSYIGSTDPLPERLRDTTEKFAKILGGYDYRGMFCTEVKVTKEENYLIDPTLRCGSPPSEVQCALIENLPEIVSEGARGNLIEPIFSARYGAMLVLKSDWIVEHALALEIDNPERSFIHGHFRIDGKDYAVVPEEFSEFGGAVGIGDTVEDAIAEALDTADGIRGYQVRVERGAFSEALDTIKKGNKLGLDWHSTKAKAA